MSHKLPIHSALRRPPFIVGSTTASSLVNKSHLAHHGAFASPTTCALVSPKKYRRDTSTMYQTMRLLGVSRQTILQRVKRGEIQAIHVKKGRKKGLRLKVIRTQTDLFNQTS